MNEDERGITPANATTITVEPLEGKNWRVTIEQGNGDVIKLIDLTEMERIQLGMMLDFDPGHQPFVGHASFLDLFRSTEETIHRRSRG
jgi:hypothetical protein